MNLPFILNAITRRERTRIISYWILLAFTGPVANYFVRGTHSMGLLTMSFFLPIILASFAEYTLQSSNRPLPLLQKITAMVWAGIILVSWAGITKQADEDGEIYGVAITIALLQLIILVVLHLIYQWHLQKNSR